MVLNFCLSGGVGLTLFARYVPVPQISQLNDEQVFILLM